MSAAGGKTCGRSGPLSPLLAIPFGPAFPYEQESRSFRPPQARPNPPLDCLAPCPRLRLRARGPDGDRVGHGDGRQGDRGGPAARSLGHGTSARRTDHQLRPGRRAEAVLKLTNGDGARRVNSALKIRITTANSMREDARCCRTEPEEVLEFCRQHSCLSTSCSQGLSSILRTTGMATARACNDWHSGQKRRGRVAGFQTVRVTAWLGRQDAGSFAKQLKVQSFSHYGSCRGPQRGPRN